MKKFVYICEVSKVNLIEILTIRLRSVTRKALLHLAARTAIQYSPKMKAYKERKLKEGKQIISIMNAVRNKLHHIICAHVHTGQKHDKNHKLKFA